MKIGNVDQSKGVDRSKRKKGASGAGSSAFADQLRSAGGSGEASASEGVVGTNALEGVDALLAMQEVGDSTEEHNRKRIRHRRHEPLPKQAKRLPRFICSDVIRLLSG